MFDFDGVYVLAVRKQAKDFPIIAISLDNAYPLGYNIDMITVRETTEFEKWIKSLKDRKTRLVINARIRRISTGNFGDAKSVGDGISELIIDYGPGYRVYFTRRNLEIVILLCGGDKSSQSKDIEAAKRIANNLEEVKYETN